MKTDKESLKQALNLFTDVDNLRYYLQKPFKCEGNIIASDGSVLIRIDASLLEGEEYAEVDFPMGSFFEQCNYLHKILRVDQLKDAINRVPTIEEKVLKDVECPECEGRGEVTYEYDGHHCSDERELTCPYCDGYGTIEKYVKTGNKIPDPGSYLCFGDYYNTYLCEELQKIAKAMELLSIKELYLWRGHKNNLNLMSALCQGVDFLILDTFYKKDNKCTIIKLDKEV